MAAHLFYPRPFEILLTDDGTPTGNSNFVGDYSTGADAYFSAEDFDYSHFAVTGFKVQLSHGPYMDGYGKIPGPSSLPGFKCFYEADVVTREYPKYLFDNFIDTNTMLRFLCGTKNVPFMYEEFADVRTYHCNFMRHGKPFIFPVLQGAKFGVQLLGAFDSEPTFTLHRFVVTGFHTSAPEYWSI